MTEAAARRDRWLFGPAPDLLLGCGLVYVVFFGAQLFAGPTMREVFPYAFAPFLTLVLGTPHYGATLLRVYARGEDRRRYALFAVWATALMAVGFVVGLHRAAVGSLLITLYFTWSPWHYSGQNYGIGVLFLRKRGVPIPPAAKRMLYGTFVLSYVLVFLSFHGQGSAVHQVPASFQGTIYSFYSLGIPDVVRDPLAVAAGSAYLVCLVGAGWMLTRRARLRDLGPTAALVGMQALWFLAPAAAAWWRGLGDLDPFTASYRPYAFLWVASGHFVQYLWISTYYSAAREGWGGRARYLGKALVAGTALWTLPTLLFAPGALGTLPYDLGLGLLAASVVNLHHFVLDGVIWKLRDGPVARVLLRPAREDATAPPVPRTAPSRAPQVAWALGAAVLVASLVGRVETYLGERAFARGDLPRLREAAEHRSWLGLESPRTHRSLAELAARAGDLRLAEREIERSLDVYPTADAWLVRGALHERRGRLDEAASAYQRAHDLDPRDPTALYRLGHVRLAQERPEDAREALEHAARLAPEERRIQLSLERVRRAGDDDAGAASPYSR